jgi:hypothetical protein
VVVAGADDPDSCGDGKTCDDVGVCKLELGKSCAGEDDCASGWCIDDFCCDAPCSGQCEACDVPGSVGTCTPVLGAPHPPRIPCAAPPGHPCGARLCDGVDRTECDGFASSDVLCAAARCTDGEATPAGFCDGNGACSEGAPKACEPFVCAGDACASTCSIDADCASGYRCDAGGQCVVGARCDGDHTLEQPGGVLEDCAPYRCAPEGACLAACASVAVCTACSRCDSSGRCVKPSAAAAPEVSVC